ncbi:hypothetical protein ES708_02726 [subsurface metagenome]
MTKDTAIKPASIESKALVRLGDKANTEHKAAMRQGVEALKHAIECGRLLAEAKAQMKHGEWLPWLGEHFEASQPWAWGYMRLYAQRDQLANYKRTYNLSISGGLKLLTEAKRAEQGEKRNAARDSLAKLGKSTKASERWKIECADAGTYEADQQFDFIITDPPYPKEHLGLYSVLAERAREWLKPTGLVLAMCGQSYLDDIYSMLREHLDYYWTAAYLTPGQPKPLRQRQVNTCWKPILIYTLPGQKYRGKTFSDVFTSDRNEKGGPFTNGASPKAECCPLCNKCVWQAKAFSIHSVAQAQQGLRHFGTIALLPESTSTPRP